MSFFPIKAKDWNRDGPKVNKKRTKTTKLPMTQAQGDEFQLKKMGQIKPHSIDKVRDDQKKRLTELENKALTILELLIRKMPTNYDLSKKKDQNKAMELVKEAGIFATDLERISFMKAFIFTR